MTATFPEYHPFRSIDARNRYLAHYDAWAEEWPVPCESRRVATSQGETFVRISGPREAPPLVLLPPTRASSLGWMLVIEALSEHYRTFAVDTICDVGRSANSRSLGTRGEAMVWLDELLDELGLIEGVAVMGASFGGWLAAEYTLHAPDRLSATVLLSPPMVVVSPGVGVYARMAAALVPTRVTSAATLHWLMPVAARSEGQPGSFFDRILDDTVLAGRCYRFLPMLGGGPRRLDDADLGGIGVPVLYVIGEHERLCPPDKVIARLKAVAPRIKTVFMEGADHSLIISKPREVVVAVLDFLGAPTKQTLPGGSSVQ